MKKILLTALVIVSVACSKNDEIKISSQSCDIFTATMEQADTKVYVDGNLNTLWNKDDSISIFTTTYNARYRFTGQTGDAEGTFEEKETSFYTGQNVPTNYAVYPYMKGTTVSTTGTLTIEIPAVQYYSENTFGPGAGVMVAATQTPTSRALQFKNLCGFLVFSFYGNETVKSITLTGNNNEKISGTGTVSPKFGEDPSLTMSSTGTESITLDCGAGVALGTTAETATSFWMAVPPVTFEKGFTVTVTTTEGWSMVKSVSSSKTITRNVRNTMSALEVECNCVYFKDSNFKAYCVENFDTDGDGEISFDEAKIPTRMTFCTDDISDITGIKSFVNLEKLDASGSGAILVRNGNGFGSGNTEGLDWSEEGLQAKGRLSSADLSGMMKLMSVAIGMNCLESLNIDGCTKLNDVGFSYNKLKSIDFSSLTGLHYLNCECGFLSDLDVSNYTSLEHLYCGFNQLTSLDVSNNTSLTDLFCYLNQLPSLDVSNNTSLSHLDCTSNQLTSLDVSNNTSLEHLYCGTNRLTSLDVSNNTSLTHLDCTSNQLTSLDVSNNTSLIYLYCSGNQLNSLNVSNNTSLTDLHCASNQLTSLDVSNYSSLEHLYCGSNQLTSLDVSNNTSLTHLDCTSNQLTSLDASNDTSLKDIECSYNLLTSLDVSNDTSLKNLYCINNLLTSLDVSNNTSLENLYCSSNQLTSLDVSNDTSLKRLECNNNLLTSLDVSNNTSLISLNCHSNPSLSEIWLKTGQTITHIRYDPSITEIKYK